MTSTEQHDPLPIPGAEEIEAALLAVPGVVRMYPSGSVVSRVSRFGAAALGLASSSRPRLTERQGTLTWEVSIGVSASRPVAETVEDVSRALEALYSGGTTPTPLLRLTVVHVDDAPAEAG